jgi:DeoR family transcriptional regulator, suf operon transcriptional repressor
METGKHSEAIGAGVVLRGPASDILGLLQQNGAMSIKQLRTALGVSSLNAVREQLTTLAAAGLVEASTVRQGAGRPAHLYRLTGKAQALFPKGYDVLLRLLLEELEAQQGREQLQVILSGVSARLAEQYGGGDDGAALHQRLAVLSAAFAQRGAPITLVERDGDVLIHEYTCPYFNVAQTTGDICAVEQQMLEQVLGRKVRLTQRLVDGHIGCQFVIEGSGIGDRGSGTT